MDFMTPYQEAEAAARRHGFESYDDYLKSDHWADLKARKDLKAHGCCACKTTNRLLGHHRIYRDLLDVTPDDLAAMCFDCHDIFHLACRWLKLSYVGMDDKQIAETVNSFKQSERYKKWLEKLERRRNKDSKPPRQRRNSLKVTIRKQLRKFLKGGIGRKSAQEFCTWLMLQVEDQTKQQTTDAQPKPVAENRVVRRERQPVIMPHNEGDIQIPDCDPIILNKSLLSNCRANGSFTSATLAALGLTKATLTSGWGKRLFGTSIPRDQYRKAVEGKFIYNTKLK